MHRFLSVNIGVLSEKMIRIAKLNMKQISKTLYYKNCIHEDQKNLLMIKA